MNNEQFAQFMFNSQKLNTLTIRSEVYVQARPCFRLFLKINYCKIRGEIFARSPIKFRSLLTMRRVWADIPQFLEKISQATSSITVKGQNFEDLARCASWG